MPIHDLATYRAAHQHSIDDPEAFWAEVADDFTWHRRWDTVLSYDFHEPRVEWFQGARLNITENCIDRHLADRGDQTAILWEPNDPNEAAQHITYKELHARVCRFANALRSRGIERGDRVCIYLPMVPELAIAVLACARIGAIHSVVFAGFSSSALAARINDASCSMLITADSGFRGDKTIDLKGIADRALDDCPSVESVIVLERTGATIDMDTRRDIWWRDAEHGMADDCEAASMEAEDPLFILYTSGSTGTPKGMVHTTAGYMVYTTYTFRNIFQYRPGDVYWCTADIGWITGHSYIVYGPLAAGATTVMFEGVPTWPDAGRFWQVVEKHGVTQFYTAPTAIRALAKHPIGLIDRHDLSSLRVLGTVGEPINAEAWHWYDEHVGHGEAPIVDTWWQTETGGIMISPFGFMQDTKPTFAMLPQPGIAPGLMDGDGRLIDETEAQGRLVITRPWPSIARTVWGNHERYRQTYFSTFPGHYFTGDGALRDADGHYRITGRVDDIVIVSGHNLGTAPIEDAIDEHPDIVEAAVVGFPHDVKGNALYAYVTPYGHIDDFDALRAAIRQQITDTIGPIAKPDRIQFVDGLPKTRSGKIMRRILRKVASGEYDQLGDTSTLLNPDVVESIIEGHRANG